MRPTRLRVYGSIITALSLVTVGCASTGGSAFRPPASPPSPVSTMAAADGAGAMAFAPRAIAPGSAVHPPLAAAPASRDR